MMKNQFSTFQLLSILTLFSLAIISCKKDDDEPDTPATPTTPGVYVVNEGGFGTSNSSISFYDFQTGAITNNVYATTNGVPLGDVAQMMLIHQGKGYIVVNNSQKIEVVNSDDCTSISTITGFQGPRHIIAISNKGYVCDWFSNEVAVVDLNTNAIINHIPVGQGPEQSTVSSSKLFVANVGGFGSDSTVSIIDLLTDALVATVQVGINPNSIVTDKFGKVWVLCGGSTGPDFSPGTADDVAGSLWRLNPTTYVIEKQFMMNAIDHPIKLQIDSAKADLYYLFGNDSYKGKIVKMSISANALNNTPLLNKSFNGLGLHATTGDIYGCSSPGFAQIGYVFRYSSAATLIDSMEVEIAPNGFAFK